MMAALDIDDPIALAAARTEHRAMATRAAAGRPTELENVHNYVVMLDLAERLERAAAKTDWNLPPIPTFGSLPLGQLNAMAVRVPGSNEHLIAFQDGVFGFGALLAKAVATSLQVKGDGAGFHFAQHEVEKSWAENSGPLLRLADLLAGYLFDGTPYRAAHYSLPYPHSMLATVLWYPFELFIFAHEFGHVIAGHLNQRSVASVNLGGVELNRINSDWQDEFEADRIGMVLTMLAMREVGFTATASYCGIDLFFSSIELVDRAVSVLVHGEVLPTSPSSTHPPPEQRRKALRQQLVSALGDQRAAQACEMAISTEKTLELMWQRIEPFFKKWRELGLRPTRVWAYRPQA